MAEANPPRAAEPSPSSLSSPKQPQQPEEKPQPALTASQVVSNLLGQHSMGDLADYNGMVGTLYGGIDLSQMESYCVKGPAMGTTATEIAVFQVKDWRQHRQRGKGPAPAGRRCSPHL